MIIIVIIIISGILISYFGFPFIEKSVSLNAKVIAKEHWAGEGRGAFVANRLFVRVAPSRLVTFELENKETVILIVPRKTYNGLSIGSIGILEYAVSVGNKRFRKFTVSELYPKAV